MGTEGKYVKHMALKIKWVPENLYTLTIWPTIEKVYKISGTHFINMVFSTDPDPK